MKENKVPNIRRKVFISHYKNNRTEVEAPTRDFTGIFVPKVFGGNDNSDVIDN